MKDIFDYIWLFNVYGISTAFLWRMLEKVIYSQYKPDLIDSIMWLVFTSSFAYFADSVNCYIHIKRLYIVFWRSNINIHAFWKPSFKKDEKFIVFQWLKFGVSLKKVK